MKPGVGRKAKSYTDTGIGLDSAVLCNHTMCLNCVWLPFVIVIFDTAFPPLLTVAFLSLLTVLLQFLT